MFKLDHKSIIIGTSAIATSAVLLSGCMGGAAPSAFREKKELFGL